MLAECIILLTFPFLLKCQVQILVQTKKTEGQHVYLQKSDHSLIISSNEKQFDDITNLGYDLLKQNFNILFDKEFDVQSIIKSKNYRILSNEKQHILVQEFCFLTMTNSKVFVCCTFIDLQNQNKKQIRFNDCQSLTQIRIKDSEICTQLFLFQEQLNVFCQSEIGFIIYRIEQSKKQVQRNFRNVQYQCQQKLVISETFLFVCYVKCEKWGIYKLDSNFNILLHLNSNSEQFKNIQQLKELVDVQLNYFHIYLIFQNGYISALINSEIFILSHQRIYELNENENLEQLIFQKHFVKYKISQEGGYQYLSDDSKRVLVGTSSSKVYQHQNFLLFIRQNHLEFKFSQKISQNYYFNFTKFEQSLSNNEFQIIDNLNKEIIFFNAQLKHFFNNSDHSYIYEIQIINYLYDGVLNSSSEEIHRELSKQFETKIIYFECQTQLKFTILKNQLAVDFPFFIQNQHEENKKNQLFVKVFEKQEFSKISKTKFLPQQNYQLLFYSIAQNYLIIQNDETLYQLDFEGNDLREKINVSNCNVIIQKGFTIILSKSLSNICIQNIAQNYCPFSKVQIDQIVEKALVFPSQIVVYVRNNEAPYVANLNLFTGNFNSQIQIEKELLLPETIKFYFQNIDFQFIQYNTAIIYKENTQISLEQLWDVTVFSIEKIILGYFVLALHDFKENLIAYVIAENDLIQKVSNIEIDDYQFVRPIKYQISKKKLIIATTNKQNCFLFIYSLQNGLNLEQIISTYDSEFFVSEDMVFYRNPNNIIEVFELENVHIDVNFEKYNQLTSKMIENISININVSSWFDKNISSSKQLGLKIVNSCIDILPYAKTRVIEIHKSAIIQNKYVQQFIPQEFFQGPISHFTIDNPQIQIYHPFSRNERIQQCQNNQQTFCTQKQSILYRNQVFNYDKVVFDDIRSEAFQSVKDCFPLKLFNYTFLIIMKQNEQLMGIIIESIYDNNKIIQELQFENSIKNFQDFEFTIKTENKIIVVYINNQVFSLLYYNELNFTELVLKQNLIDASFLSNSEETYLFLYMKPNPGWTLIFEVNQLQNQKIIQITEIHQELDFKWEKLYQQDKQIHLVAGQYKNNTFNVTLIQFSTLIARIISFDFNLFNQETKTFIHKILRMPQHVGHKNYYFFRNHLLLQTLEKSVYYYYLAGKQEYYDYQFFQPNLHIVSVKSNNTHFVFQNDALQLFIGQLNFELVFELFLNSKDQRSMVGTLSAHNEVNIESMIIELTIKENNSNQKNYFSTYFIGIMSCVLTLLLMIFVFRRKRLKHGQNLKRSQSLPVNLN